MPTTTKHPDLPIAFCEQMQRLLSTEEAILLEQALDSSAPCSIRLNPRKLSAPTAWLGESRAVPWCNQGYYLAQRPTFTADPLWHSGAYYAQEASSMLLSAIAPLLPQEAVTALDLCAAPGGKSTLLSNLLPEGSVLVSNEVVRSRAHILRENLYKWGNPSSVITSSMPEVWGRIGETFDLMLVDAPCSGEGMFRKDPNVRKEWSPQAVELCAERQTAILSDAWNALKTEGLLVYSTCTLNREENEDIVTYIVDTLGGEPITLDQLPESVWRSPLSQYPCYRMMPHRAEGEGLFMAVFRKRHSVGVVWNRAKWKGGKSVALSSPVPQEVKGWVSLPDAQAPIWGVNQEQEIFAYTRAVADLVGYLRTCSIFILSAGIPVAILKGKNTLPHPALAHSWAYNTSAFPIIEVDYTTAMRYLATETITLSPDAPRGWCIISYEGQRLGFVKNLGNRANNIYPHEWRIRFLDKILQGECAEEGVATER